MRVGACLQEKDRKKERKKRGLDSLCCGLCLCIPVVKAYFVVSSLSATLLSPAKIPAGERGERGGRDEERGG